MKFDHSHGFSLTIISTINTYTNLGLQVHHRSLQWSINQSLSSLTLRIPNSLVLTFLCVIAEFILVPYLLVIPLSHAKPFDINDNLYSQQIPLYPLIFASSGLIIPSCPPCLLSLETFINITMIMFFSVHNHHGIYLMLLRKA